MRTKTGWIGAALALAIGGCSSSSPDAAPIAMKAAAARLPNMTVYKSPACDCCQRWVDRARQAGFTVAIQNTQTLGQDKQRLGVPAAMASCHTAEVAGYVIEGHVPLADVQRLVALRPHARGLAVPGMPLGSPGMEHPAGHVQPFVVHLIADDGTTSEFARHGD